MQTNLLVSDCFFSCADLDTGFFFVVYLSLLSVFSQKLGTIAFSVMLQNSGELQAVLAQQRGLAGT